MLKPVIILLFVCFAALVHAKHTIEDCDPDDFECLEDFITTTTTSKYSGMTSSSSAYDSYSTLLPFNASDFSSDFHEAKVSNSNKQEKHDTVHKEGQGVVQDGNAGTIPESTAATEESSGLNNVQTGVLSACGVLVVGGIAVGIFVWRNTTEKTTTDIETQAHHPLELSIPTIDSYEVYMNRKKMEKRPMEPDNFLPIGSNFLKESTIFSDTHRHVDKSLLTKFDELSFNDFDLNKEGSSTQQQQPQTVPSSKDPQHDPSAITYALQRFLRSPVHNQDSIPLQLTE